MRDQRKEQFRGIVKAARVDSVTTAKKDETEHYSRMVNSDPAVSAREAQKIRSDGRASSPVPELTAVIKLGRGGVGLYCIPKT